VHPCAGRPAHAAAAPPAASQPQPDPEEHDRQLVPEFLYSGHFLITIKTPENGEHCR